jgi:Isochorismatase family
MTSLPIRDQTNDHLLTPKNCALIIVDYQPIQVGSIAWIDRRDSGHEHRRRRPDGEALRRAHRALDGERQDRREPADHPSAGRRAGRHRGPRPNDDQRLGRQGVRPRRQGNRPQEVPHDRTVDRSLPQLPALDALREGYEVYPIVDAVGGTSVEAHRAAFDRVAQAGAQPTSWVHVLCELQRDWARKETVPQFAVILFAVEGR